MKTEPACLTDGPGACDPDYLVIRMRDGEAVGRLVGLTLPLTTKEREQLARDVADLIDRMTRTSA